MLQAPCHTLFGPLGPLTLNYIIIIYIKEANGWQCCQVKEAKEVKEATLRLGPLACLEWVKEGTEQRHLGAGKMLENLSGGSKKVYIINLIRLVLQVVENKGFIEGKNKGLRMGQAYKFSSHLCPNYSPFIPYLGKFYALFRGFIPLEKMA